MFTRIAIVNRGEAACRLIHAVRELNAGRALGAAPIRTVALFTDEERGATFVLEADEAYCLGPASARPYLDLAVLERALTATGADAAWVGWGFVAENPAFAELCGRIGVTFVGPSARAMRELGDKISAKLIAEKAGVPVAPWSGGPLASLDEALAAARRIGFPLMLKAAAGGGGRGIRVVESESDLREVYAVASAEALRAFGSAVVFLEKRVTGARHVEVQVIADGQGTAWALGVRDCSIQRRNQKIIEESASPVLRPGQVRDLKASAERLAIAVGYRGACTVEFLYQPGEGTFSFLEVNTRLQVEHPVTEATTGTDLVKMQLSVAAGERLTGERPVERGHAVEARLNAEDPDRGFAPAPGRVALLRFPSGAGIRVDAGVREGDVIPSDFDSMIAKIIAVGANRDEALARLRSAVAGTTVVIENGATNKTFLSNLLGAREVIDGSADTGWVDRAHDAGALEGARHAALALAVAAINGYAETEAAERDRLWTSGRGGRPHVRHEVGNAVALKLGDRAYQVAVARTGTACYQVRIDNQGQLLGFGAQFRRVDAHHARLCVQGRTARVVSAAFGPVHLVEIDGIAHRVSRDEGGVIRAQAPGLVVAAPVTVGDEIEAGAPVLVMESMKMETVLRAAFPARLRELSARVGSQVEAGAPLARLEPLGAPAGAADVAGNDASDNGDAVLAHPVNDTNGQGAPEPPGIDEIHGLLLGFDSLDADDPAAPLARYLPHREEVLTRPGAREAEIAVVGVAADLLELCLPVTGHGARSLREEFHVYLRSLDADRDGASAAFRQVLTRLLANYGIDGTDRTPAVEAAVFRLFLAIGRQPLAVEAVTALLRRWLDEPAPAEHADRIREVLDRLVAVCRVAAPQVADLARSLLFHWYERPDTAADCPVPDSGAWEQALLSDFHASRVPAAEPVLLYHCVARSDPGDQRLVAFARVPRFTETPDTPDTPSAPSAPDAPGAGGQVAGTATADEVLGSCLAAIGRVRHGLGQAGGTLDVNHLWLDIEPTATVTGEGLAKWLRGIEPRLPAGIEDIRVRGRVAGADGTTRDVIARLAHQPGGGVTVTTGETGTEPLAPLDDYGRQVLRARRRNTVHPYEIVRLLTGTDGHFAEYDLVTAEEGAHRSVGYLAPVDRPRGRNTAAVVAGVISTPTPLHPCGVRRVLLLGDPAKSLGALSEPECARIHAALDLAEREGLPVEWFALSSGARISMESGTENMDWVARALRRIVEFTQRGGEINIVVTGITVGAQPYWNAEATMLMHTKGILVMTPASSMVLTGKQSLDFSGGVSAEDNFGIGGYARVMGPNGQAQYWAPNLAGARDILMAHYDFAYVAPGEPGPRRAYSTDPVDRDVTDYPHCHPDSEFTTVGDIFSAAKNPDRKKPFDIRTVMRAVADQDHPLLERWPDMADAETAVTADARIGGRAVTLIGIESRHVARHGFPPADGPGAHTAGTLFPRSSKKVARAINAASGNRPVVVLANLSGFDGSPESMRALQLEYGAEIGRAIVNFDGPIVFCVIARYHGGAFVVFSKELNEQLTVLAVRGSFASVIGGAPAAAVVFARTVDGRVAEHPRVRDLEQRLLDADNPVKPGLRAELLDARATARAEQVSALAVEFDAIHSIDRAVAVGSVDAVISAAELRPRIAAELAKGAAHRGVHHSRA